MDDVEVADVCDDASVVVVDMVDDVGADVVVVLGADVAGWSISGIVETHKLSENPTIVHSPLIEGSGGGSSRSWTFLAAWT